MRIEDLEARRERYEGEGFASEDDLVIAHNAREELNDGLRLLESALGKIQEAYDTLQNCGSSESYEAQVELGQLRDALEMAYTGDAEYALKTLEEELESNMGADPYDYPEDR
jgi:hypothetical protein